jgi:hypothetical protein
MVNANRILNLERAAGLLISFGPVAAELACDVTPMPDGSGTVADRFKAAVLKLAPPMDQLWDAAQGQAEAVTLAAVASEAAETPAPVLPIASTNWAQTTPTLPVAPAAKPGVKIPTPAQKPATGSPVSEAVLPKQPTFRKMAGF